MVFFIIKKYFKIGTPLYMSPEMLQHQEYDYNSDVWSLCMVFYEMIHGYCFWTAENPQQLISKILNIKLEFFLDNIK